MNRILFPNHVAIAGGSEIDRVDLARHFGERSIIALLFSDGPLVGMLAALATAVARLLADRPLAERLADAGRDDVCARCGPGRMLTDVERVVADTCGTAS